MIPAPVAWLARTVVRGVAHLPAPVLRGLRNEPPLMIDGQTLDPMLQLLHAGRRRRPTPGYMEPTVAEGRRRLREAATVFDAPRLPVPSVRDLLVDGGAGPRPARHYAPDERAAPLLVYLHGGGFAVGDLETHDQCCRILCREGRQHVLAVDYRLAPEHPFPAALEDAHAALRWAQANAELLGADPARVAIGGDSAGANLATVVAQTAARGASPAAQLLVYPPTDAAAAAYPSRALFGTGFFLDGRDRAAFSAAYLDGTGLADDDPRVSPLRRDPLPPQPPALVVTAGFDILRDEGEAYAERLRAAGTPVRGWREATLGHGFVNMTGIVPAARAATVRIAREWRALLDARPG